MANKNVFAPRRTVAPPTNATNVAGAPAYDLGAKHTLAQLACTGMLADTFYTDAESQLAEVIALAQKVEPEYVAKLAIYSRQAGKMKDMPALLCAVLFGLGEGALLKQVFPRVIDNGRMLRNFVQIIRSGKVGRTSLGTSGKKLVQAYLDSKSPEAIFRDSVGNDPSMADVLKLAHPRPSDATRAALYRYILGKELSPAEKVNLPQTVLDFENFKSDPKGERVVPNVPFQMLTALDLSAKEWTQVALNGNWTFVRMNLNTFARHGVLDDKKVVAQLADKLRDELAIEKARVFPYQLMMAYMATDANVPVTLKNALQDAMETATKNVEAFDAPNGVLVFPDVSSSMGSAVTGNRGTATTVATCRDVAALVSACVLRRNDGAKVIPFDTRVHEVEVNGRDSIMTNAKKLALHGGGTNCSAALAHANNKGLRADVVIYVSDNASWLDAKAPDMFSYYGNGGTETMKQWRLFKKRNPNAKMVNINIQPYGAVQTSNDPDILNIGGFSDTIFETINNFVSSKKGDHWVKVIEAQVL